MSETNKIQVKEAYRNYAPPFNPSATIHRLLRTVPDKYLMGLDCVVLMNFGGLSRKDHVLFHELGHHIHYTIRPDHKGKEDVADKWAGKLTANFIRKKYWYALPIIIPAAKIYSLIRRKQRI